MEAQALKASRAQTRRDEMHESENHPVDARPFEQPGFAAVAIEALAAADARASDAGARTDTQQPRIVEPLTDEPALEEDETQLAAIRDLMTRACARGIWLTLGEIAEATEFGEASISAQLRHLRKAHHGGYHVEKRRRHSAREAGTTPQLRDARRGPLIWEYLVLPPA